mgnify:CR=1 FL=1
MRIRVPFTRTVVSFSPAHDRKLYLIGDDQESHRVSPEHIQALQNKVASSLEPIKHLDFYLGGGLAIAYTLKAMEEYHGGTMRNLVPKNVNNVLGGYYRDHAAIDILCFPKELPAIVEAFESQGKYLVGRGPMIKVSSGTKAETYHPLSIEEALGKKNLRITNPDKQYLNLYLHHFETSAHEEVTRREDGIFVTKKEKREIKPSLLEVVSDEDNVRVKVTDFEGCRVRIGPNLLVKVAHPWYLLKAKVRAIREKNKDDSRHELDIVVLENILTYIDHEGNGADCHPLREAL